MATTLKGNISSRYFEAAQKLYPRKTRRKIIAYVESYDDIPFWRSLLEEFENEELYFQVMLPSSRSLAKGKKMVLMNSLNSDELGKSLIACVDSDYDYLMQGISPTSRKIIRNKYIFQTYAYAIENYHCYAESLHEICVQATLNDRHLINFTEYMKRYSQIAYPLFIWSIFFYRRHDNKTFSMSDFNYIVRLKGVNLRSPYHNLDEMQERAQTKLAELERRFPNLIDKVDMLASELTDLGLEPDNTYLFIQGHHLVDNVVMKLLTPVCTVLRREREQAIRRLADHDVQYRNELTSYQNSLVSVDVSLKRNTRYKDLFLYKQIQNDIKEFLNIAD